MSQHLRGRRWIERLRLSRIGIRLLAFNLLVVFLPIAGVFYLDVYERELLAEQERGMVQEARGIAAALGVSPDVGEDARRIASVVANQGSRIRIFGRDGSLIADTAATPASGATSGLPSLPETASDAATRDSILYKVVAWFAGWRDFLRSQAIPYSSSSPESNVPVEVRTALTGRYGAAARPTPAQRSMTLSSAWPIRHGGSVTGVVVVSQTTYRTLSALYRIRLRLLKVILLSVAASILLSALVSATVVRPIDRLRRSAAAVSSRIGALTQPFTGTERKDEIGELARALQELTRRLDDHIRQVEAFSADVAHEFRNPLAAIRVAAETIATTDDPAERQKFLDHLTRDVDRLERLISGVRDLATLDAQIAMEARKAADIRAVVASVIEGAQLAGGVQIVLRPTRQAVVKVPGSPDRLAQVLENLIANAKSFSPEGSPVEVSIEADDRLATVSVADRGPGIPEGHLNRVFERFFTYRPDERAAKRQHTGLGLAIAKAIVDGYGGTIEASNRPGGGAAFQVRLPLLSAN